jgi:hypothetical protein
MHFPHHHHCHHEGAGKRRDCRNAQGRRTAMKDSDFLPTLGFSINIPVPRKQAEL